MVNNKSKSATEIEVQRCEALFCTIQAGREVAPPIPGRPAKLMRWQQEQTMFKDLRLDGDTWQIWFRLVLGNKKILTSAAPP